MAKVFVNFKDQHYTLETEENKVLLDLLRENKIDIPAPCGGKSRCGKCTVQVVGGHVSDMTEHEKNILGKERTDAGYRLSCMTKVLGDCRVIVPDFSSQAAIMTDLSGITFTGNGIVNKLTIELNKPNVHDQVSDLERISQKCSIKLFENNPVFLNKLPKLLRQQDFKPKAVFIEGMLADIPDSNRKKDCFGIAVDIGTTTVAVYLYDFVSKAPLDQMSFLNPQKAFGADVISRIDSCIQSEENLIRQKNLITDGINRSIETLCNKNGLERRYLYGIRRGKYHHDAFDYGNISGQYRFFAVYTRNNGNAPIKACRRRHCYQPQRPCICASLHFRLRRSGYR